MTSSSTTSAPTPDILFDVKNAFYLGNWQQCLNEAQKVKVSNDDQKLERDIFMYRAYTAQKKYGVVIGEIRDSMPAPLRAVKLLARYLSLNNSTKRCEIIEELDSKQDQYTVDPISSLIAATIYYYEQNFDQSLKMLHNSNDIECIAFSLQVCLRLDRIDLARKQYRRMSEIDEYCTLSQLSQASIFLFQAGEKLQDAFFIFQELKEKFGPSPMLLNGQACCLIGQGRYDEAEPLVQETSDKDSNYVEAIINQMVLAQFCSKSPEVVNRYINQLKDLDNNDWFAKDLVAKEKEFDKIALEYHL